MRKYKILDEASESRKIHGEENNDSCEFEIVFDFGTMQIHASQTAPLSTDNYISMAVTFLNIIRQLIAKNGDSADVYKYLAQLNLLMETEEFKMPSMKEMVTETPLKN